jgi:uncharacterized protein (TIGR02145 family)
MKTLITLFTAVLLTVNTFGQNELPSYIQSEGLVAYYPFNGNANDASGNGYHGTTFLNPQLSEGHNGDVNSAYDFEWENVNGYGTPWQRIELPFIDSFYNTDLVISAWIKPETLYWPNNSIQNAMIIGSSNACGDFLEPSDIRFALHNGDGSITFTIGPDIVVDSGPGAINVNNWQHVLARVSANNIDLFVNSVLVSNATHTSIPNFAGCMVIGEHHQSNGHWYYFDGIIDDIGIWNRALTNQEIQTLYSSSSGDILLNGTVSAENNLIKNVADPTDDQDAATKNYVDNNANSFSGSYNDLTDTPVTYTQTEVDDLIAEAVAGLQSQIDALQPSTTVTDIDGNTYDYLPYGAQVWTVENAEMVTYRDGTPIPQVTDDTEWENLTTGAWCYYDNDPTKGKLYNWYAVAGIHDNDLNTPNKELAPEGWHVPSDEEWTTLENYLITNGYNYDGTTTGNKIAKAMASTSGWNSSENGGVVGNDQTLNNSSGFNAFPKGGLGNLGYSGSSEGYLAIFWCFDENTDMVNSNNRTLSFQNNTLLTYSNPNWNGFSVRFVRD